MAYVQKNRPAWAGPSHHSFLCSDHFSEDCFEKRPFFSGMGRMTARPRRVLTQTAVPGLSKAVSTEAESVSSALEKRRVSEVCLLFTHN